MNELPLVSVCLITYNHEQYIAQAIDGILMQELPYKWELIIADDCSTDGTRAILEMYQQKYPDLIRLVLQEQNVGPTRNWIALMRQPRGKYIAYFEGDDYWTDPLKLRKQVDFLIANEAYSIVWTKYDEMQGGQLEPIDLWTGNDFEITFDNIFKPYRTQSLTCVFKKSVLDNYELERFKCYDITLYFMCLKHGKGRVLDENTAVYRIHAGGSWSGLNDFKRSWGFYSHLMESVSLLDIRNENVLETLLFHAGKAYYMLANNGKKTKKNLNTLIQLGTLLRKQKRLGYKNLFIDTLRFLSLPAKDQTIIT